MSPKISQIHLLRRSAALVCAAFAGLGLAAGPLRAQSPVPDPDPSPAVPTPYSSPLYHAGGAFTPPLFPLTPPVPFPDPLYGQLQGTPTGLVPGSGVNAGTLVSTEIPSFLLGNYLPTAPPTTPATYFPNHFRDGTAFSWSAPLTFLTPNEVAPATSPTGDLPVPNVESTPVAVNVTEYPFIQNIHYIGTVTGTTSTPDNTPTGVPIPRSGTETATASTLPTTPLAVDAAHLIRQVVYFGRAENISTVTTTGGIATVANTPVGAIYCVDGFTGEVIWRYQTSSYSDGSVFSTPAVAYMNVLVSPGVYANKAVVVVGDNNGFVYCLDATGNGDGTSNSDATTTVTGVTGLNGLPIYGAQPTYGSTTSATTGSHVGTTSIYWAYRPDPAQPQNTTQVVSGFNANSSLPVPGPFGIASPNVYIDHGVSTTPDANGVLESNAIIYLGNTRDCVYALDGIGAANNRTAAAGPLPAYNLSLPPADTGIPDAVPTVNPRWWFSPDSALNSGISFESTPAILPSSGSDSPGVIVTSSSNPSTPGNSVTFTATVVDSSGNGGIPTGTVTFTIDGVQQTQTLVGGSATSTPVVLTTNGINGITASYSGDGTFPPSTNMPVFDQENGLGTASSSTLLVTSSANPSVIGQAVTFTATQTYTTSNTTAPTGTIQFTINGVAQPAQPAAGTVTSLPVTLTTPGPVTVQAVYSGDANYTPHDTSFEQFVVGQSGPTVYIGSSQELGATSNAGRIYALNGLTGPGYATTATGTDHTQRPLWAYPNLYASGKGNVITTPATGTGTPLPVRPALGNITGSPVVFTNTDDVVPASGSVPAHPRTRIYFAADSGLEVPAGGTAPNPRPASDATGRVWAINTDGTTAFTTEGATTTVWSFPEANDPNNAALDATPEPSVPMGAFLDATPAMGFVQFPTTIQYGPSPFTSYTHTDTINTGVAPATDVKGKAVPMLYVGTNGTADLGFYALDVDGSTDAERGVYRLESPTGSSFTSSPVLVTNSSTTGGNGGAVYATSGNTLLQITATPISNINTGQAFAFIGVDSQFSGGGPISGPSVAAANTSDLQTNTTITTTDPATGITTTAPAPFTLYGGTNATDFVYFGDGTLGFCRGITPVDPNYGGGIPSANFGGVTDTNPAAQYSNKFFLQAYIFDGSSTYPATTTNMGQAIGLNGTISGFEWGGFAYVRIGNVVPPCPAADVAAPNASELVADPTDPTLFYGNGQAVNFSVGSSSVTVPATILTSLNGTYPNANGFIQRSDKVTATATFTPPLQLVSASNQLGWLAAYSYPIGSIQTRIGDTPGAFRRIRQATQTATTYTKNSDGTYTATGTLNLIIQTTLGSQYATGGTATTPPTGIAQTPPSEQPTFGILNPLAVEGLGKTLPVVNGGTVSIEPVGDSVLGAGPFGPISSPTAPTIQDLSAFSNGSNHLTSLPNSGYNPATEDPTKVLATLDEQAATGSTPITIATSVGDISDGGSGDNTTTGGATPSYGLEVENRSLVGSNTVSDPTNPSALLFPPLNVAMVPVRAHWNDNTSASGTTQNGPGATVNPLPWEDLSALSSIAMNTSQDYPDIPASAITHTLFSSTGSGTLDIHPGNPSTATLSAASVSGGKQVGTRDSIQVSVAVPPHQPANLQVWDGSAASGTGSGVVGPETPETMNTGDYIFPQGYIEGSGSGAGINAGGGSPQRVYVDVGGHGRFSTIYPYREVQSFVGVPVDMRTEITNGTVSLGNGPSSLGIQTEQSPLGVFDPYTLYYQPFFKPLTVLNEGNTNLLNAQFNQQLLSSAGQQQTLPAYADANDPLSVLGGFDYNSTSGPISSNQRTYNGTAIPLSGTTIPEEPFIFRTSLDTDLMLAYGRNPGLVSNFNALYPGATFHKPRVGVASTTLTVPDAPDAGVANYSLDYSPDNLPKSPTVIDPATNLPYKAVPYVGISVPFGTPVGSYATTDAQPLRLFEGQDPSTHGTAAPYYPPTYGGSNSIGGHAAPAGALVTQLPLDANAQPTLPASTGVKLNLNVIEDRLTDGFTVGALPMIDAGQAGLTSGNSPTAISTPDFAPAAFRDPNTGDLSVYWTSGRTAGTFGIFGANVPFNVSSGAKLGNYFYPANPAGNWWTPITPTLTPGTTLAGGTNSGLSIVQDPPVLNSSGVYAYPNPSNTYAFDVAVISTAPYSNMLYSYTANPGTGALTNPLAVTPTTSASQVKYGIKGLSTQGSGFTNNLWAFWTGTTRGRTALYYNSQAGGAWGTTVNLLPVPAGLTAVADASPMLMMAPVNGALAPTIEVTYCGTAPDGNIDLYVSRYVPAGTTTATASQLDLAAFPPVTENLRAAGGWYQSRDVAWSRTGALNVSVVYPTANGPFTQSLLYNGANVPLFTKAIYDKASGLLVLTGVKVPETTGTTTTTNTVYVDAATGRVRFSPALTPATQNFTQIRATFSPEARRLTTDTRADTAPVTFMDMTQKPNDAPIPAGNTTFGPFVEADRRWTIWRKAGIAGTPSSATLYFKAQRLTFLLPNPIALSGGLPVISGVTVSGTDVTNIVDIDYRRGRIYFPISTRAEGQTVSLTYTDTSGASHSVAADPLGQNTVQWQDEQLANDNTVLPAESAAGSDTVLDYGVPIDTAVNENNVAAFLDPFAGANSPHKVWLFWNSTRNGTADIYSETIDPRFAPGP